MMAVVAWAALFVAPLGGNESSKALSYLAVEFALPWLLLSGFGRSSALLPMSVFGLALVYCAWGAVALFWPGQPGYFEASVPAPLLPLLETLSPIFHPGPRAAIYGGVWEHVRRWNWACLAAFYALAIAFRLRTGMRRREIPGPDLREAGGRVTPAPGVGMLGASIGGCVGVILGLIWSRSPALASLALAALLILGTARLTTSDRRDRAVIAGLALAIFWGFGISAQLVETPPDVGSFGT